MKMGKISDTELLAALENLRLKKWNSTESPDYILRVATAIVAANIGYKSRSEWSEELQRLGLIEYKVSQVAAAEAAAVKYEMFMSRL